MVLSYGNAKFKFEVILLLMALNPIGLGIGIFEATTYSNIANLAYYIFLPWFLNYKYRKNHIHRKLQSRVRVFLLSLLILAGIQLSSTDIKVSIKTLILFFGTWLWANLVANLVKDSSLQFESRSTYWAVIRVSCLVILQGLLLPEFYTQGGRLLVGGGFAATSMLSLFLFYYSFFGKDIDVFSLTLGVALGITLLVKSGSIAGTLAVVFFVAFAPVLSSSKRQIRRIGPGRFFFIYLTLPVTSLLLISSGKINATRNFRITKLFSSDPQSTLGTVEWRKSMYRFMWDYFQSSPWVQKLIGNGLGSGTAIAQKGFGAIPSDYTSGRVFHNGFLQLLFENGLLGLIAFSLLFFGLIGIIPRANFSRFFVWYVSYGLIVLTGNPFAVGGTFSVLSVGMMLSLIKSDDTVKKPRIFPMKSDFREKLIP